MYSGALPAPPVAPRGAYRSDTGSSRRTITHPGSARCPRATGRRSSASAAFPLNGDQLLGTSFVHPIILCTTMLRNLAIASRHTVFQARLEVTEDDRHQPVPEGGDDQGFEESASWPSRLACQSHQFQQRDRAGERGILLHGDKLVADVRCNDPEGLRQHDPPHRLPWGHAQCGGRLALAVPDRLDAGAEDLAHIRTVVEAQRHYRRPE